MKDDSETGMTKSSLAIFIAVIILLPLPCLAQITVDLQLFIPEEGIIFLSDLNIGNLGNAPLLFTVTIENHYLEQKNLHYLDLVNF